MFKYNMIKKYIIIYYQTCAIGWTLENCLKEGLIWHGFIIIMFWRKPLENNLRNIIIIIIISKDSVINICGLKITYYLFID